MSNTKTEAQRLAEFKDLEYWPAGVGLTDWVESVCAELLRLDDALADELNNRDVLDKMLTQCITERDQLRAQVERLQGGEPVAWRVRRHDAPKYWIVFLHKPVDALQDPDREVQPLYTPAAPSQEPVPEGLVAYSQHLDKHITAQEPVTLTEREIGDCIDKTNRESQYGHHHFGWSKDLAANIIAALREKEQAK